MAYTPIDRMEQPGFAVALANKMARMAWVMMTREVDYDPDLATVSVN